MNKKREANENETIRKKRRASIIISENLRNRSALLPSVRLEMKERLARSRELAAFNYLRNDRN
jgi:hypothetical protein